jgi:hypothetical protein
MTEEWKYTFPSAANFYCTEAERTEIRQGQSCKGRGTRGRDWSDEICTGLISEEQGSSLACGTQLTRRGYPAGLSSHARE